MTLSIIIVNYKTAALTVQALNSVYAQQTNNVAYEIFVVDNESGDNIQEAIQQFGDVRFIQMGYNAGFARANNAAIRKSTGEAVLLLNSDTIVLENAIDKCFTELMNSPFVAAAAQLLNADLSPQITGNYAMRGGLNYLLPLPYLGNWIKKLGEQANVSKPNVENATGKVEVDWINGAFLMVKRSAIERAGLMDESFFLYAEETEWCYRLRKFGKLCVYGGFHVIHLQGESAGDAFKSNAKGYQNLSDKKGAQIIVSNMLRIRKEFGVEWFLVMLAFYVLEVPLFFIVNLFSKKYPKQDVMGYTRNIGKLLALFPNIILNKPGFYKLL